MKPGQPDRHTARWRGITLGALLVGYGGYYLCRSDLSLATPLLLQEFGGEGFTKTHIGAIVSVG
ncbi:MAG TPA: glycerol-3-phosphate transporter, partial [Armatimonadota bacterium]|nr:glycerol-3-phosphate transporter [Armatimonadota bacterium]